MHRGRNDSMKVTLEQCKGSQDISNDYFGMRGIKMQAMTVWHGCIQVSVKASASLWRCPVSKRC
eukprot:5088920-Amphidinium_carterae.1